MLLDPQIFSGHEAAIYFGCSYAHLRRLRTLGWIRAVEDKGPRSPVPFDRCHFEAKSLQILAWDYLLSLSIMDIVAVRRAGYDALTSRARRGIPTMVVRLILKSSTAKFIQDVVLEHALARPADGPDPIKLDRRRKGFDNVRAHRLDLQRKAEDRTLRNAALPLAIKSMGFASYYDEVLLARIKKRTKRS